MQTAARRLAFAMLAGPWQGEALVVRCRQAGATGRWVPGLIRRAMVCLGDAERPSNRALTTFILDDRGFQRAWDSGRCQIQCVIVEPPAMAHAAGRTGQWPVPRMETPCDLAAWLGISLPRLDWFADVQGRLAKSAPGPLAHYRYRWLPKRPSSPRLIEQPKPRLKQMQRRLLDEILNKATPHEAVHGFCPGRSVATFVAPHVGQAVVLKLDLRDFFTTIRASRIAAIFRTMGYPQAVARLLAGLCTNITPTEILDHAPTRLIGPQRLQFESAFRRAHLPQGSPSSPALANLAAFGLDCRLAGLARAAEASYTRYADDLLFSGGPGLARSIRRFYIHAGAIAWEEGFAVNTRKTRIMRASVRQQAAGLVVNQRPNIARRDYDRLKAILYNCLRHGPAGQNRHGHTRFREQLAGRIAYVTAVHRQRGERLKALFEQIDWQ